MIQSKNSPNFNKRDEAEVRVLLGPKKRPAVTDHFQVDRQAVTPRGIPEIMKPTTSNSEAIIRFFASFFSLNLRNFFPSEIRSSYLMSSSEIMCFVARSFLPLVSGQSRSHWFIQRYALNYLPRIFLKSRW